jgi:NAD(P)-dependent dehydrogenase (short-subunit alcohol dehydrogenase family)
LACKVALVTGAGFGIGHAIACCYGAAGPVWPFLILTKKLVLQRRPLLTRLAVMPFLSVPIPSVPTTVQLLVAAVLQHYAALHIACNNAGIGGAEADTGDYPIEAWDKVIGINLSGVFYGMRYQIPALLASGGGAIVNMASVLGQVGFRGHGAYVAAKHGVIGLTRSAALEYAAQGIRINAVGPGFINTPLIKELPAAYTHALEAMHPLGRLGESAEIAELVL